MVKLEYDYLYKFTAKVTISHRTTISKIKGFSSQGAVNLKNKQQVYLALERN
jgi:hypothetical protein